MSFCPTLPPPTAPFLARGTPSLRTQASPRSHGPGLAPHPTPIPQQDQEGPPSLSLHIHSHQGTDAPPLPPGVTTPSVSGHCRCPWGQEDPSHWDPLLRSHSEASGLAGPCLWPPSRLPASVLLRAHIPWDTSSGWGRREQVKRHCQRLTLPLTRAGKQHAPPLPLGTHTSPAQRGTKEKQMKATRQCSATN